MQNLTRNFHLSLATLALTLAACVTSQAQDILSVNFYAYGNLNSVDNNKVTLEAGESAGVGAFNTTGWHNYPVPWAPSSSQAPVTITSPLAATATLTLNDVRNGGPYAWSSAHTNLVGDGNGDLMDGHCNATDDPFDGSNKFDMEVTNIPYDVYSLVVYMGANKD
jgi:hypothetical protein